MCLDSLQPKTPDIERLPQNDRNLKTSSQKLLDAKGLGCFGLEFQAGLMRP